MVPGVSVALAARALHKRYGRIEALAGVDIEVAEGQLVGLLGPNGAGKTTTFNMVVGVIRPDGGAVRFQTRNIPRRVRTISSTRSSAR